ncbi:hypothetical protein Q73_16680 [Bacillus coahuilensis m2-6]|uniref:hypothetical protein n=1 Tax=Bacillus coahuilensis TaxID=408580 RepID=UPI00018512C2|nr:hypothetical protein [Bacillus coahuilensis]KUP03965.1 hypothetical protein Q73_16680 [Bacillus coahuilensis m2-6]
MLKNPSIRRLIRILLLVFAIMSMISGTFLLAITGVVMVSETPVPNQSPAFLLIALVYYAIAIIFLVVRIKVFKPLT